MKSSTRFACALCLGIVACGRAEDEAHDAVGGGESLAGGGGQAPSGGTSPYTVWDGGSTSRPSGGSVNTSDGGVGGLDTGAAGSSAGGSSDQYVALAESSWNVDVAFSLDPSSSRSSTDLECRSVPFVMHFTPHGSLTDAVLGRDGDVATAQFMNTGLSLSHVAQDGLRFPVRGECTLSYAWLSSVNVSELELRTLDTNGDGVADQLTGSGKAVGSFVTGDVEYRVALTFQLNGVPDAQAPTLPAGNQSTHPLDGVRLAPSEPISTSASLSLVNASGTLALTGVAQGGAFAAFDSPTILPFGTTWTVEAVGTDLAGLPFAPPFPVVTTLADPGLFAQDGFESDPNAMLSGDAKIVAGLGDLPALSGDRSLLVPQRATVTLHLSRPPGATMLRFSAQMFSSSHWFSPIDRRVEAAVIGGSAPIWPTLSSSAFDTIPTGDSTWPFAAPKLDVTMPLIEPGADVVVRISTPACDPPCFGTEAMLIDDLHVE